MDEEGAGGLKERNNGTVKQSNNNKRLIVIGGPTASGKTAFAIRLARHFGTAIISADSRQFYREMNIGTAKPTAEERAQAPHYFIDSLSIGQEYSVGDFERDALQLLEKLFQQNDVVVLAGGAGLYIKALCEGLDEFPEVPPEVRRAVEEEYRAKGLEFLQEELSRIDPGYYQEVDKQNPRRLLRAIAVFRVGGRPFSSFRTKNKKPRSFTPIYLQLHWPRQELYSRIGRRVEQMMAAGLEEEARRLYPKRRLTALQTVGYQELFDHFDGATGKDEAIAMIRRNSRRYAKRQLTWHRRDGHWKLLRPEEDWELALQYIEAARTEGLSLNYCKTENPAVMEIQLLKKGGEWAALHYSEKKGEALLQGPFLPEPGDEWAGGLLVHEAFLLAGERQIFAFAPDGDGPFRKICEPERTGPEALPGWMEPAWENFRSRFPEGRILYLRSRHNRKWNASLHGSGG